jgi:hypothetical protein
MNNYLNTIKLPNHIQYVLSNLFKAIEVEELLEENTWIAGGFPRVISLCINSGVKQTLGTVYKYFYNMGDIDVFCSSKEKIDYVAKKINDEVIEARSKRFTQSLSGLDMVYPFKEINSYDLPFTFNYERNLHVLNDLCIKNGLKEVTEIDSGHDFSVIQTQFVNKFIFSGIKECLDNFDFSNSKIAISLKNNEYYLHYTDDAHYYNSKQLLNIVKVESPFLSSRITKYTKKYNYNIQNEKVFRNHIKDYLYKIVQGKWPEVYGDCFDPAAAVKTLHTSITLDSEDLCLFLGKFVHMNRIKCSSTDYGIFTNKIIEVDWATHHIGLLNG